MIFTRLLDLNLNFLRSNFVYGRGFCLNHPPHRKVNIFVILMLFFIKALWRKGPWCEDPLSWIKKAFYFLLIYSQEEFGKRIQRLAKVQKGYVVDVNSLWKLRYEVLLSEFGITSWSVPQHDGTIEDNEHGIELLQLYSHCDVLLSLLLKGVEKWYTYQRFYQKWQAPEKGVNWKGKYSFLTYVWKWTVYVRV